MWDWTFFSQKRKKRYRNVITEFEKETLILDIKKVLDMKNLEKDNLTGGTFNVQVPVNYCRNHDKIKSII